MANLTLIGKSAGTVSAYDDSIAYGTMLGSDDRAQTRGIVMNGIGSGISATADQTNDKILIGSGMGALYGRQFLIASEQSFSLGAMTGIKYCVVYAEVSTKNVTAQSAKLRLAFDSGGYPVANNADLFEQELGIAAMPLWRFIHTAGAASPISNLTKLFEGREPGRAFRTRSLPSRATIDGNAVADLKDGTTQWWKKARKADVGTACATFGGHTFDGSLLADGELQGLAALDTVIIKSDGHTTAADNVAGNCWWGGDDLKYRICETPYKTQADIWGYMISMGFDMTHHNPGFLGIGSHWEYIQTSWKMAMLIQSRWVVGIKRDDTGGTFSLMNPLWWIYPNEATPNLRILLPSQLTYTTTSHGKKTYHYPEVEVQCLGEYRFYGYIELTPIVKIK